ncbi:MAG TPA: hypothetical protein DEG43_09235 [Acidimicrobiaceae bacterium]|nr:hypothetical protein [Acidimicrobiaceae bacterium]
MDTPLGKTGRERTGVESNPSCPSIAPCEHSIEPASPRIASTAKLVTNSSATFASTLTSLTHSLPPRTFIVNNHGGSTMAQEDRTKRRAKKPSPLARAARREQLLDAAIDLIRTAGPEVAMDEIAAACGITKPVLYSHFGDKAGLGDAMAERFSAVLLAEMNLQRAESDDLREFVSRAFDTWLRFVESDPQVYRFLTKSVSGNLERFFEHRLVADMSAALARTIRGILRDNGADTGPAEPWAFGIVGMIHLSAEWWLDRRSMARSDLVDYLTALLWTGLASNGVVATDPT